MLSENQAKNLSAACAIWLEDFLKTKAPTPIKCVYVAGEAAGFSKAQVKAARAWHGKDIATRDGENWFWES